MNNKMEFSNGAYFYFNSYKSSVKNSIIQFPSESKISLAFIDLILFVNCMSYDIEINYFVLAYKSEQNSVVTIYRIGPIILKFSL